MMTIRKERIEFNPQKDLLGWIIEKNRRPERQTLTGLI